MAPGKGRRQRRMPHQSERRPLRHVSLLPASGYRDSALFWLGNAQYGNRAYKEAMTSFRTLVANAPDSPRAHEALLSIANCQRAEGRARRPAQPGRAAEDVPEVRDRRGGSGAAGVAEVAWAVARWQATYNR
jgi:hypothetical protein